MGAIKEELKRQVNSHDMQKFYGTSATILSYDKVNNVARIKFFDPNSGTEMLRENVPLCITMGGVTGGSILPGQRCLITFTNNNIFAPVITGISESLYNQKTFDDQGAYLVSSDILQCEKPKEIIPMSDSWIDYGNQDKTKYENDLGIFSQQDATAEAYEIINTLNKYKDNEQGITNLDNHSTFNVKENGDIDIFVANNLGIRISPSSRNISVYGTLMVNGKEMSLDSFTNQIHNNEDEHSQPENVHGNELSIADVIKVNRIENIISSTQNDVDDIEDIINMIYEISGDTTSLNGLKEKIKTFKSLREEYYSGSVTSSDLDKIYNQLINLQAEFSNQLKEAEEVIGGNI